VVPVPASFFEGQQLGEAGRGVAQERCGPGVGRGAKITRRKLAGRRGVALLVFLLLRSLSAAE